jgi:lysophospholipase L1-like esterase
MNKKLIIIFIILTTVLAGYLLLAHHYIYKKISSARLTSPDIAGSYLIGNGLSGSGQAVYSAIGDSLTSGVGAGRIEKSYPYLLAQKIAGGNSAVNLKIRAYPGARTSDLIKNQIAPVIADNPDFITLLIGVNDIHGNVFASTFKKNYELILGRLTKETSAKIYLVNIPIIGTDALLLPPFRSYFDSRTKLFNSIINELAVKYKVKLIDLYSPTAPALKKNNPLYAKDLFHPSAEGYKLWAEIIYAGIDK